MNILHEAIELLIQPPGDLVYFLVTLFALQQALIPVLTAQRADPEAVLPLRWTWAVGGLLAGRAILSLVGLLGNVNVITPALIIPPLERLIEVVGIALVLWALQSRRPAPWHTWVLIGVAALAFVFYLYDAIFAWPALAATSAYNGTTQEWIWETLALVFLLLGLIVQIIQRDDEWEWAAGMLVFWILGHAAQMFWPVTDIHFSDWERLTALVVLPLLAILVQRQLSGPAVMTAEPAAQQKRQRAKRKEQIPQLDVKALQTLLQGIEAARELEPSLIIASSRLAQLLDAEFCAIGLMDNEAPPAIRVVATHPPTGQLDAPLVALSAYDTVLDSWKAREPRVIQPPDEPPWLDELHGDIGFGVIGPLSMIPLCYQDACLGLLFLGNPRSNRSWDEQELSTQQLVASLLAGSIGRLQRKGGSIFSLREQEDEQLSEELESTQEEVRTLNAQIANLKQEIQERDQRMAVLNQEFGEPHAQTNETEIGFWQ
ncbi:MAG: GAF domain-containing protein, partial [Anaerolineae bacterium]|nr:GAF domain-containing protein [Anaerolineae bacterium]